MISAYNTVSPPFPFLSDVSVKTFYSFFLSSSDISSKISRINTRSSIGYFTLQNAESISAAYPGVGEKYNVAMDISTYAKTLARSGDNDFTFMMNKEVLKGMINGFEKMINQKAKEYYLELCEKLK